MGTKVVYWTCVACAEQMLPLNKSDQIQGYWIHKLGRDENKTKSYKSTLFIIYPEKAQKKGLSFI